MNKTHLEIDESILVSVKRSEDVVAEFLGIAIGEKHFVHVNEFGRCQASTGAVLLQTINKNNKDEKWNGNETRSSRHLALFDTKHTQPFYKEDNSCSQTELQRGRWKTS